MWWENTYFNLEIGNISFTYQIRDKDRTFYPVLKSLLEEISYVKNRFLHELNVMDRSVWSGLKNVAANTILDYQIGVNITSMYSVEQLSDVYESKTTIVYTFVFHSILGATFAVIEGSLFSAESTWSAFNFSTCS